MWMSYLSCGCDRIAVWSNLRKEKYSHGWEGMEAEVAKFMVWELMAYSCLCGLDSEYPDQDQKQLYYIHDLPPEAYIC